LYLCLCRGLLYSIAPALVQALAITDGGGVGEM
jgi:hypothetical protein